MPESPRPPVLDYRKPEKNKASEGTINNTIGAAVFTFMGFFSMSLLSTEAWKFSAVFSALGILFAALALRTCGPGPRRIVLYGIAALAGTFFVMAILTRFNIM